MQVYTLVLREKYVSVPQSNEFAPHQYSPFKVVTATKHENNFELEQWGASVYQWKPPTWVIFNIYFRREEMKMYIKIL